MAVPQGDAALEQVRALLSDQPQATITRWECVLPLTSVAGAQT